MMMELDPLLFSSTFGSALPCGWGWVAWFSTSFSGVPVPAMPSSYGSRWRTRSRKGVCLGHTLCRIWFDSGALVDLVRSFRVFSLASVAVIGSCCVLVVVRSD